uniref:Family with sequence similarity 177 member A1 n=1 Tax=Astyanax mexicanus TaxID=7994 RepID=A0A3B1ILP0_ASTMX
MADLSVFLSGITVSLGQNMDSEKNSTVVKDFENVELGDIGKKQKVPRRTIYFASGETMEEFSTDEEDEEEELVQAKSSALTAVDPSKLTWGPYFWFHMWRVATSTISVCDYLGEKVASLLGITSPKYQYAIDEYYRMKKEEEEEVHLWTVWRAATSLRSRRCTTRSSRCGWRRSRWRWRCRRAGALARGRAHRPGARSWWDECWWGARGWWGSGRGSGRSIDGVLPLPLQRTRTERSPEQVPHGGERTRCHDARAARQTGVLMLYTHTHL